MEINFWNLQMKACIFTKLKLFRNCFGGYFLLLFKLFHNCFRGYFLKLEQHRTVTLWNTNFCRTLFLQAALEMFVKSMPNPWKMSAIKFIFSKNAAKMQPAETYIP